MSDILDEINKEYDAQARKIDRQIAKATQNKINNKKKETLNKFKKIKLTHNSLLFSYYNIIKIILYIY